MVLALMRLPVTSASIEIVKSKVDRSGTGRTM